MFFSVFIPTFVWALAVANALAFVWTQNDAAFGLWFAVLLVCAVGSFRLLHPVGEATVERLSVPQRLVVYGMAFLGLFGAATKLFPEGWMGTFPAEEAAEAPLPREDVSPAVADGPLVPAGPARASTVPADVVGLIPAAQEMLRGERMDVGKCGGDGTGEYRCLCDYLLAVADQDGRITVVEAYQGRPSTPPGYTVDVRLYDKRHLRACGTNPGLDVAHPPGQTVLAVRTVVKTTKDETRAAVFTPFTDELNIQELRERGLRYWWQTVLDGRDQLAAAGVSSLQRPGERIVDVIPPMTVFMLGLVENLGSDHAFGTKGTDMQRLRELNAVLVMFGANGTDSFSSRVSGAKAAGVLQIVDTTGKSESADVFTKLRTWYPAAAIPSYQETVTDHHASVRFAYVHLDEELRALRRRERLEITTRPLAFGLFSAAGYNGTATRAARVMRGCTSEAWVTGLCPGLHAEAANYVRRVLGTYPLVTSPEVIARLQAEIDGVTVAESKTE